MAQFNHKEIKLEEAIEAYLCSEEGGYVKGSDKKFNAESALDEGALISFVRRTQSKAWERYEVCYGAESERRFIKRFCEEVESEGLIYVLRHGFKDRGVSFNVAYFAPETSINPELVERYKANELRCVRQFHYSPRDVQNTIDIVLLLNGIPLAALELKDEFSGQNIDYAILQYKKDRDMRDPIFAFNRRLLVCFAVDLAQVFMATRIAGSATYHLDIKKNGSQNIIFPRYHQFDVVSKLLADVKENGSGKNYLIQHSAGSGKSNSIAWLAHRLSGLHNAQDNINWVQAFLVNVRAPHKLLSKIYKDISVLGNGSVNFGDFVLIIGETDIGKSVRQLLS